MSIKQPICGLFARPTWLTIGWMIVLAHTLAILHQFLEGQFTNRYRIAGLYFVLLAAVGTLRRWGPPVMFALGGFSITFYWQLFGGVSSSEMDAAMQWIGLPAIVGVLGALVAYGIEIWRHILVKLADNEGWPPVSSTRGAKDGEVPDGAKDNHRYSEPGSQHT
jgi:hypothetical protein